MEDKITRLIATNKVLRQQLEWLQADYDRLYEKYLDSIFGPLDE